MADIYDVLVIGAGPAGEHAAGQLAGAGLRVAIVERELAGGECSYWGCIPSKTLLRPGDALAAARRAPGAAEAVTGPLDAAAAFAQRDYMTSGWRDDGQAAWLDSNGITLIRGTGRLAGERAVEVETADGAARRLRADRAVVLATGSRPVIPPVPGLAEARPWDNRAATSAKEVPRRLLVLGGGAVGVEMAQAFRRLGSEQVVVLEGAERLLAREEPFAGQEVRAAFEAEGITVVTGVRMTAARRVGSDGPVVASLSDGREFAGDEILVAVGRRPATGDLGLDCVGLEPGRPVPVDRALRAAGVPGGWLYAIGDCNGLAPLTHMGKYHGRVAAAAILGQDVAASGVVPRVTFTDPQVCAVGRTAAEARAAGLQVTVVSTPTGEVPGAYTQGVGIHGTSQLVIDDRRRTIVGATFTGPGIQELLHSATVAICVGATVDQLQHAVPSFPTVSEVWLHLLQAYDLNPATRGLQPRPFRKEPAMNAMDGLPIGDYALLSDCQTAALVSRAGSVDWLCFPRFDAPAVFARILDPAGGHFAIRPAGGFQARRRYVGQTMALETTFRTEAGTAVLTDAMAVGRNERGHDLGAGSPGVLLRQLACTDGEIDVDVSYAPRPEYGLIHPILEEVPGGLAARGGAGRLLLSGPAGFEVDGATATARLHLTAGQTVMFALQHGLMSDPPLAAWDPGQIAVRLSDTMEAWRSWSAIHQTYEGPWRDLVHHSGRVLQALTFAPTGAIVAAPTTSLPETVGGERNWDYRYTWVRDASLTMEALWVAACPDEAGRFFGFLADAAASQLHRGVDLQIMFGIGGERDLSERELGHLAGWRDSRPVRVGNGAWTQRQLDVYGELLGAAWRLVEQLGELDPVTQRFLAAAADTAAARWKEKDQGIWEIRGEPRDFLYSKLMCWVALDRAIALAPRLGAADKVPGWTAAREEIRAAILENGWNEKAGAFTQAFGGQDLDASNLMLACTGFLPGDDPRMKATIDATAERLTDDRGLVYRYLAQDGLSGEEGTFLLCTFWLAHAQALAGEVDRAMATFERAVAAVNDVGLLAEEVDASSGEMIGNFPQAFSHIGLINAAWAIAQAQQRAAAAAGPGHRS